MDHAARFQQLEERLALAVNFVIMPLSSGTTSLASTAFAYDIVINDNPSTADPISNPFGSGFGTGQDAYIRGGTGNLLLSDNGSFLNPIPLTTQSGNTINFGSGTSTSIGAPSTIFVSTGDYQSRLTASLGSVSGTATAGGNTLTFAGGLNAQRTFAVGQTLFSANITGGSSTIATINSASQITIAGTFIAAGATPLEMGMPTAASQPFAGTSGMTAVSTTAGSTTISMASTAQLRVGMLVTGSGMAGGTYINAIDPNGTDATLSQAATLTNTAAYLKFSAGLNGTQIFTTGTGAYRFYLPIPYPHAVSGSVASSANSGRFDFGSFGLAPNGAGTNGNLIGLQSVSQPTGTTFAAPVCGGGLNTMTTQYDATRNASYITFNFYSNATGNAAQPVNNLNISLDPYVASRVTNAKPESVTIAAGQTVNQRLMVDFAVPGSTVNINSPLISQADANNPGIIDSYDPIDLTSTNIYVNQDTTSLAQMSIGRFNRNLGVSSPLYGPEFTRAALAGFGTGVAPPVSNVNVNATVSAANYRIQMDGTTPAAGTTTAHGTFNVSQQGSLVGSSGGTSSASDVTFNAIYTDIRYLGDVRAVTHNYLITAPGSADQYDFTTRDAVTGNQSGLVVADTMVMTLSAPQGGTVDLNTALNTLRFDSGTADDIPYNYAVSIADAGALVVNAVAASSGPISIQSTGDLTVSNAAVQTVGDITLQAGGTLSVAGNIVSGNGLVSLVAPSLALTGTLTSGGIQGASLLTTTGGSSAAALVRAGGIVKRSVRLASETNYTLSTLANGSSFGGGTVVTGDRILLKNQTVPSENGIYVVQATGSPVRATDANTAAGFVAGMNVFVREGTQEGEWTFQNVAAVSLGVSNLQFVPSTATRVYGAVNALNNYALGVDVATTAAQANLNLATCGLTTIDGVTVTAGQRVLVKNQTTNPAENGIYVASTGPWTRASDADSAAELLAGSYAYVAGGATQATQAFALDQDVLAVGTSTATFSAFAVQATRINGWSPIAVLDDVAVATTVNIDLTTGGLLTIDGVVVSAGQRVLVKNQIDATQNGIYVAAVGGWSRAADVPNAGTIARDAAVYVLAGTQNAGTAWQFNDATRMRGTLTANTPNVSGLLSTSALSVGMLVTGPGIPAGTKIQAIGTNGTSLVLSANALANGTVAISFVKDTTVNVGTDPLPFIPAGGVVDVTSATTIGGTGRYQASTALLTAGTSGALSTSTINVLSNVGRMSAIAPGAITLDNSTAMEIELAQTSVDGTITANAAGTLTALSVSAAASGVTARPVSLSSTYGDVVAESITATRGDISATAYNGGVAFTKARRNAANIRALAGSVKATADSSGAVILVDGRLLAQGTGSDVVLASNLGQVTFTGNANVTAADQLKINTPNSTPSRSPITATPAITAARLSLTSQFGAATSPPSWLGTYQFVDLNRTDTGNLTFTAPSSLTVEGATTSNGSITFSAPDVTVTGPIVTQGASTDVSLTATAGNLVINSPVTSLRDITLSAAAGEIGGSLTQTATGTVTSGSAVISGLASTAALAVGMRVTGTGIPAATSGLPAGTCISSIDSGSQITLSAPATASGAAVTLTFTSPTALLTAPRAVTATASTAARMVLQAGYLNNSSVTSTGGFIGVTDTDGLVIGYDDYTTPLSPVNSPVTIPNGGTAAFSIGSAASGGTAKIGLVDVGATGSIVVTTYGDMTGAVSDTSADIKAQSATLLTTAGKIKLDTDLDVLSATAQQKNQSITINDIGGTSTALQLRSVGSGSGSIGVDVDVTAVGTLTATNVLTGGKVTLKTTGAGANILVDSIVASGNVVDLQARNSIQEVSPGDASADITATSVKLQATDGSIDVYLAASAATANATTAGTTVTLKNDTALSLGTTAATSLTLNVGGVISQTGVITAGTLVANATNGSNITLTGNGGTPNLPNQVGSFAASSVGTGGIRGNVAFTNGIALDVGTAGIQGAAITLTTAGGLTDTGSITGTSLAVTNTGSGAVTLDNAANSVASLAVANAGRNVTFTNAAALDVATAGIQGAAIVLNTVGGLTDTGSITGTSLAVTNATSGAVTLDSAANSVSSLAVANTGRNVTFTNAAALDVATAGIQGGAIVLNTVGGLTDTGSITGTSLAVTNTTSGAVTLDNAANSVASLAVANAGRNVTFTNAAALDVATAGIQGSAIVLNTAGGLTDTGSITGTSLAVTNTTSGAVTLDNAANSVASLAVANTGRNVTFTNAATLDVATAGIQAAAIVLNTAGGLTDTGSITGTSLAVTNTTSGAVTLDSIGNSVTSLSVANTGRNVTFTNAAALDIATAGIQGGAIVLSTVGGLSDTGALTGTSLVATNTGSGNLILDNASNSVPTLSSATNTVGDVTFVTQGSLATGPGAAVTAGTATAGDGNVLLRSVSGNIVLNGTVSAVGDTVTLDASNGTITQTFVGNGVDATTFIWYAQSSPTTVTGTFTVLGPNLTGAGDLTVSYPGTNLTVAGASTLNGNVSITADSVTITRLVSAGGTGKDVTITAATGDITFTQQGRAQALSGNVTLSAAGTGAKVAADNTATYTTVTAGTADVTKGLLTLVVDTTTAFTTAVNTLAAQVKSAGTLTITETDSLAIGGVSTANGSITINAGGSITQNAGAAAAVTGTSLAVASTAGTIKLDNAANSVGTLTAANATRDVTFTNAAALNVGAAGIQGAAITLTTAGGLTDTGSITGTSLAVTNTGSGVVALDSIGNSVASLAVANTGRSVTFTNAAALDVATAGIQGATIVLNTAGGLTDTGSITGTSLAVTNTTSGAVTLDNAANSVTSLAVANAGRNVTFTNAAALDVANAGIQGGAIVLNTVGGLTDTGSITGTSLAVTNTTSGAVTLDSVANSVSSLAVANAGRNVTFTNAAALDVATAGIQGSAIVLNTAGGLTDTGSITGTSLAVTNTGSGAVTLNNAANDVASVAIANSGRAVTYVDATGFAVAAAGISGSTVALTATTGAISSTGTVSGGLLTVTASTGATLTTAIDTLDATITGTGGLTVTEADAITLGSAAPVTTANGSIVVVAGGAVTVNQNVVAGGAGSDVTIQGTTITLNANVTAPDQVILIANPGPITGTGVITSGGTATINAVGNTTISVGIVANRLDVYGDGGIITIANPANDVNDLFVSNLSGGNAAGTVTFVDVDDLRLVGTTSGILNLTVAGGLTQSQAVVGTSLAVTNGTSGAVTLTNVGNAVASLSVVNAGRNVTFVNSTALDVASGGIQGAAIALTAAGGITDTGSVAGTSLAITNTGSGAVKLDNTANSVGSLTVANATRDVTFTNAAALDVGTAGIQGAAIVLTTAGGLTDTGAITGASLAVTNGTSGAVTLDNAANKVASLSVVNTGRAVTYVNAGALDVGTGGIQGSAIALTTAGGLTDTGSIAGASLAVTNTGSGAVTLDNAANSVTSLAIANAGRDVTYANAAALDIAAAGIQGAAIVLGTDGGLTDTGAVTGTSLAVTNTGSGAVTLDNAANSVTTLAVANVGRAVTYTNAAALTVAAAGIQASTIALRTVGGLGDTGSIVGTSLAVTNTGSGAVTLDNVNNSVSSLAVANTGRAVTFSNAKALDVAAAGIQGSAIALTTAGGLTDTGAVTGTSLAVTNTGSGAVTLDNAANSVASLAVANAGRDVTYTNAAALDVAAAGIQGAAIVLGTVGGLTDTGAITGTSLAVTNTGSGAVTLDNAANSVGSLAIANTGRAVTYVNAAALDIATAGIQGSAIGLTTAGGLTDTGAITGTSLAVTNTGSGAVALNSAANSVGSLAIANTGRDVTYVNAAALDVAAAGIQGAAIVLGTVGGLTDTGAITGTSLAVTNTGSGAVALNTAANNVATLAIINSGRPVTYVDANGFAVAGIDAGAIALTAGGAVTQSAGITGTTLTVTAGSNSVVLNSASNLVDQLSATAGVLQFTNAGTLFIDQVVTTSAITLATAGNLRIGPPVTPSPLLKTNTTIDLRGVTGIVTLENNGRIIAPGGVTLRAGESIYIPVVGGDTAAAALANSINQANSLNLPVRIEIAPDTTITLTTPLPAIQSPLTLAATNVTLVGSGTATTGFQILSGASGGTISGVTFQGFTTAGVALNGVRNFTLSGNRFVGNGTGLTATGDLSGTKVLSSTFTNNTTGASLSSARNLVFGDIGQGNRIERSATTGTGLLITGTSAGTRVLNNAFTGYGYGIQLTGATGVTVGGTTAGQSNSVTSAAKAGVYASGFCTGSSVIKTTFSKTSVPYNVATARNLKVVK